MEVLRESLFALNQSETFSNSIFKVKNNDCSVLAENKMVESSENKINFNNCEVYYMSLI